VAPLVRHLLRLEAFQMRCLRYIRHTHRKVTNHSIQMPDTDMLRTNRLLWLGHLALIDSPTRRSSPVSVAIVLKADHFSNWRQYIINALALIHQSDSWLMETNNHKTPQSLRSNRSEPIIPFRPCNGIWIDSGPTKTQRNEQEQECV
jgi:hypothetical protein